MAESSLDPEALRRYRDLQGVEVEVEPDGAIFLKFLDGPWIRCLSGPRQGVEVETALATWLPKHSRRRRRPRSRSNETKRIRDMLEDIGVEETIDLVGVDGYLNYLRENGEEGVPARPLKKKVAAVSDRSNEGL